MYALITNGQVEKFPYSIGLLRKDHPNTSFPKTPTAQTLASFGVYPVRETNPSVGENQKLQKSWTPEYIGDEWLLNHQAVDMTVEEIAERDAVVANGVREERGKLLAETDWVVVFHTEKGTNIPLEWETYRQALRDITNHVNFPHLQEADWPTKP
jgi:hypothetical protein